VGGEIASAGQLARNKIVWESNWGEKGEVGEITTRERWKRGYLGVIGSGGKDQGKFGSVRSRKGQRFQKRPD